MVYVKVNGVVYPASIVGQMADVEWDRRASKSITLEMDYETAKNTFVSNVAWSIICEYDPYVDENGEEVTPAPEEFDNSDFCVAGDITDHRNGTITVKMGRLTDLESAYEMMLGGIM